MTSPDDAERRARARPRRPRPFIASVDRPARLDPRMTFDSFVPGSSNRLAFAAAQSVAETPGRAYNPLMIYGNSGLGKTHLLHAIGNYVHENYPGRKVCTSRPRLPQRLHSRDPNAHPAGVARALSRERRLLIDDIQFMETRGETFHEEIFHTYNALHGEGKQIVLTSDRSPRDLAGLRRGFAAAFSKASSPRSTSPTLRRVSRSCARSPSARESSYRATSPSGSLSGYATTFASSRAR